jgi:DNA-binding MarR family transcriptional regulator
MTKTKSIDGNYDLWWLLSQVKDAIEKAEMKILENYNLSPRDSKILFLIHELGDNVTILNLAQYCFRQTNSISEHLIRMEKAGLVERTKSDKGKRLRVKLTDKGLNAYQLISSEQDLIYNIMSTLSGEEHKQLTVYLELLRDSALKEIGPIHYNVALPSQLKKKYRSKTLIQTE